MKRLAIEFSSPWRSVATLDGERCLAERCASAEGLGPLGLVEAVLAEAGIERNAVELLVVGLGPGSYTGIRMALSIAQGWQLASGAKVAGASGVVACAMGLHANGVRGRLAILVDAQRGDCYEQEFELEEAGFRAIGEIRIERLVDAVKCATERGVALYSPDLSRKAERIVEIRPQARWLGALPGVESGASTRAETIKPIYLRGIDFVKAPPRRVFPG